MPSGTLLLKILKATEKQAEARNPGKLPTETESDDEYWARSRLVGELAAKAERMRRGRV